MALAVIVDAQCPELCALPTLYSERMEKRLGWHAEVNPLHLQPGMPCVPFDMVTRLLI